MLCNMGRTLAQLGCIKKMLLQIMPPCAIHESSGLLMLHPLHGAHSRMLPLSTV